VWNVLIDGSLSSSPQQSSEAARPRSVLAIGGTREKVHLPLLGVGITVEVTTVETGVFQPARLELWGS